MQITRKANVSRRILNVGIALVLAVSTVSASMLVMESQRATAAPGVTASTSGFNSLSNWRDDRYTPSGNVGQTNTMLTMDVDGDNGSTSSDKFYWTEGRHADLSSPADSIKATLHVDSAWQNVTGVRAGLWGVSAADPAVYPIIEFSNRNEANVQLPGVARFQVWTSNSGWTVLSSPVVYNQDYTFEIVYNDFSGKYEFYINETLVFSETAAYGAVDEVIFNQFNAHIPNNDYTVTWKDFSAGNHATVGPTLQFPSDNQVINTDVFDFNWSDVDGAVSYEFQNSKISGAVDANGKLTSINYTGTSTTSQLHSSGAGEVTRWWQVRAVNANGDKSAWSSVWKMSIDKTVPVMPVHSFPSNNASIKVNDFWFDWTTVGDAVSYEMQNSQSPSVTGVGGSFVNVQWAGDYQMIQPTDSTARSVGANGTWYWQVRSVDAAGNKSAWTTPWGVTIDMVAPLAPSLVSPADNTPINGISPVANNWDSVSDAVRYIYQSYNVNSDGTCNLANIRWTANYTDNQTNSRVLDDGLKFCWRVKAVDAAGNESAWSSLWKTVVDNSGPIVILVDHSALANVITPNITATDASLPLTYAWTAADADSATNVDLSDAASLDPEFTVNVDGAYSFNLVVADAAGNQTTQLFTFTYTTPTPVEEPVIDNGDDDTDAGNTGGNTGGTTNGTNTGGFTDVDLNDGIVPEADDEGVLGVEASNNDEQLAQDDDNGDVLGATTQEGDSSWTPFGLVWYWWLVILAGASVIGGLLLALVRRLRQEEA